MFRPFAILTLAAFSTTVFGCPDAAPDPCGSDTDCDQCQTCSSGSCVSTQEGSCQPVSALMAIEGSVTIPNAVIEVAHGGTTISATADESGGFVLEIPEPASTVPLLLRARDASEPSFELVSLLPDSTTLIALAGTDAVLSQGEYPGTRITPLSTVLYATMKAGLGRDPQSTAELSAAEHSMRSLRDGAEIARLAAALQLIIEDSAYSLPAGTASTVALAVDVLGARAILEGFAAQPGGDPTAALVESMAADPMVVTPYRSDRTPSGYYDMTLHRNGVVGGNHIRWRLDGNAIGLSQRWFGAAEWELSRFVWEVTAAGELEMTYAPPFGYPYPTWFTVEEVAGFYPDDAELQRAIWTAVPWGVEVWSSISAERFARLWEGQAVDLTSTQLTVTHRLSEALALYDVEAADVAVTEDARIALLLRDDALPQLSWTEAMTTGTWSMHVVAPSDIPRASSPPNAAGDPVMAAARVEFIDATSAVATGAVSSTPLNLDYEILNDGRLRLIYPTGEIQTVTILAQEENEFGLLSTFTSRNDGIFTSYDRSVRVDPTFGLSIALLASDTGQYWQTTANDPFFVRTSTGQRPLDSVFGFHFGDGGLLDRLLVEYGNWDTLTDPFPYWDETWVYHVDQGVVRLKEYADHNGPTRCDPGLDPSCWVLRERTWQPLAQRGDLLYVLESERFSLVTFYCDWDDDQEAWIDNDSGGSCDYETAYGWLFTPRVNAYYVDNAPAF